MELKEISTYILIIIIGITMSHYMNVISSGSMEPVLYKGDIVIIDYNPSTIETGDIIIYHARWLQNKHVIHRVIAKRETSNGNIIYILKGDNNADQDPEPVSPTDMIAKVVTINNHTLIIPKIGYITLWFQGNT
ncbi:MAG: signal peptidase I [Methanobacterium sp.]